MTHSWKRRLLSLDYRASWESQAFDFVPCVKVQAAMKEGLDASTAFRTNTAPFLVVMVKAGVTEPGITEEPLFAFFMAAGLVKRDERCCNPMYREALGCNLDPHEGEITSHTVDCKPTLFEALIKSRWLTDRWRYSNYSKYSSYIKTWQKPAPRESSVCCAVLCSALMYSRVLFTVLFSYFALLYSLPSARSSIPCSLFSRVLALLYSACSSLLCSLFSPVLALVSCARSFLLCSLFSPVLALLSSARSPLLALHCSLSLFSAPLCSAQHAQFLTATSPTHAAPSRCCLPCVE